jgi:flagellar biosynthesis protein FlhF
MKIKKFVGFSLKEATERMKSVMGSEAVILSSKVIEDMENFGKRKLFEITAGIEDEEFGNEILKDSEEKKVGQKNPSFETELKKLTEKIYNQKKLLSGREKHLVDIEISDEPDEKTEQPEINEIRELLRHREVEEPLIDTIIDQLQSEVDFISGTDLDSQIQEIISSLVKTEGFSISKGKGPKVITLVGPTGVGKTTCIAKLALISKILHKLNVGLISIDTYRLGALDQLRIFSEVSGIDFLVAYEPKDIKSFLKKFSNKDLVFIDTVGRSQKNSLLLNDIQKFLDAAQSDEIYLVLSATSSTRNLIDIAQKFKIFGYNGFVFTKLDESVSFGNILNLSARFDEPIKYLTNGQVIPDDIIAADPDFISNLIFTGKLNG